MLSQELDYLQKGPSPVSIKKSGWMQGLNPRTHKRDGNVRGQGLPRARDDARRPRFVISIHDSGCPLKGETERKGKTRAGREEKKKEYRKRIFRLSPTK